MGDDRQMTWDELCAEMVKQRKRAEKAEAELASYKNDCTAIHEKDSLDIRKLESEREKLSTEIWRLENAIKSKNPKKWEFKTWVDKCTKAEARVKELEEGLTKIYDVVAKVSVDIHHAESGESWNVKQTKEQETIAP